MTITYHTVDYILTNQKNMHVQYSNRVINILRIIQTQILNRYCQEWEQSGSPVVERPRGRTCSPTIIFRDFAANEWIRRSDIRIFLDFVKIAAKPWNSLASTCTCYWYNTWYIGYFPDIWHKSIGYLQSCRDP